MNITLSTNSLLLLSLILAAGSSAACGDNDEGAGSDTGSLADAQPVPGGGGGDVPDAGGGGMADASGGGPDGSGGGGQDGGGSDGDAGIEVPDAASEIDNPLIWVHGDSVTNDRVQLLAYAVGSPIPATPALLLPPGETAQLGMVESPEFGTYDITPNGDLVAFPADLAVAGRFDLYVAPTDGSAEPTAVVTVGDTADVGKARISPDGRTIAFTGDLDVEGLFAVYVVPAQAAPATPIRVSPLDASGDVDDVVWSNDSTSVLMTIDDNDTSVFQLWIADVTAASPSPRLIVPREAVRATMVPSGAIRPILARDGRVLFKGRMAADNVVRLHVVDMNGANLGVLPGSEISRPDLSIADIGPLGLSPDSLAIAFGAEETVGVQDVFVLHVFDGGTPTRLTTGLTPPVGGGTMNPDSTQPLKWRPDSREIAIIADYATLDKDEPFVVPLDGSGQRRLAHIGPADPNADAEALTWSPDGSQIFVVADHRAPNDVELFVLDPALVDQEPTLVLGVTTGGDLRSDVKASN